MSLAGAENNGTLPRRRPWGSTPTMSVPFEAEFTALKPASCQQNRCECDNCERYKLLPIHAANISTKRSGATNHFV
jgi:hypothetical protein